MDRLYLSVVVFRYVLGQIGPLVNFRRHSCKVLLLYILLAEALRCKVFLVFITAGVPKVGPAGNLGRLIEGLCENKLKNSLFAP